jgi:hypothetical protein
MQRTAVSVWSVPLGSIIETENKTVEYRYPYRFIPSQLFISTSASTPNKLRKTSRLTTNTYLATHLIIHHHVDTQRSRFTPHRSPRERLDIPPSPIFRSYPSYHPSHSRPRPTLRRRNNLTPHIQENMVIT